MTEARPSRRTWPGAAALFLVCMTLSVLNPVVLVAVPFAFLALASPGRTHLTMMAGFVGLLLVLGGTSGGALWLVERGWAVLLAGGFLAVTLVRPGMNTADRGILAVGIATLSVAGLLAVRPESWEILDWLVASRVLEGAMMARLAIAQVRGDAGVQQEILDTLYRTADFQGRVFPALMGLASLAALAVAWWLYQRLSRGRGQGLGAFGDFRFTDQLVWILIAGVALIVLAPTGPWIRVGTNALVFAGGLYVLRGAAVVVALNGGVSLFGFVLLGLGLLFAAPLILAGALIIGLGDTWIDIRSRIAPVEG